MLSECRHLDLIDKLADLAKITLSDEEKLNLCRDIVRIAEYLRAVGEAARDLNVDPLYYVWDKWGFLRDYNRDRFIIISNLPTKVKDGYVIVPWRGGKIEEG